MKKVIMAAMLLVSTISVFAADVKSVGNVNKKLTEINTGVGTADECSMTLTTTIGPSFAQVKVTCSGTAATCVEAAAIVKSCIVAAKDIIK